MQIWLTKHRVSLNLKRKQSTYHDTNMILYQKETYVRVREKIDRVRYLALFKNIKKNLTTVVTVSMNDLRKQTNLFSKKYIRKLKLTS